MQKMKLWILERKYNEYNQPLIGDYYDTTHGFVIRAKTEKAAREIATASDKYTGAWNDQKYSSCSELKVSGDPGVIMEKDVRG